MNLLALDTSSKTASCAVFSDGILIAESFTNAGLTHSQTILPMVEAMLKHAKIAINDIDAFAVSAGPGSFTGLRIGISAVKGMAMAMDKPCAGVSTLCALAAGLRAFDGYIAATLDARREQVYAAIFHCKDGELTRVSPDEAVSIEELGQRLSELNQPIMLAGDGAELCLKQLGNPNLRPSPQELRYQRATGVAYIALRDNIFTTADKLEPIYLRIPQAEREHHDSNRQ